MRLADTLAASDPPIAVTCLKLGPVKTGIRRSFPLWMKWLVPLLLDPFVTQSPEEAAGAALHLLLEPDPADLLGPTPQRPVLFTKIGRRRPAHPVAPRGVLADPAERQRLTGWAERLAAAIRSDVTRGEPSRS